MTGPGECAPYLPFDGGRFRLQIGLMPLALADWLEIDRNFAADLAAKRHLLASRHSEVFAALPEADAPARELLALLAEHLPRHHPTLFCRDGTRLRIDATGESWDLAPPPLHPLDLAGRLVQEDLCLMQAEGGTYRLVGASLCFPSRWRLADKLGQPLAAIHDPVPGYSATLERPVERFFAALKAEKPVWRLNWTIRDDPAPFQPETCAGALPITAATAGERLWLRVERQTLRRLPQSGAVVFAIRTHITRLDAAIAEELAAADLAAALRAMPEETREYKNFAEIAPALIAWLDARAASSTRPLDAPR
jgi:dimethylamine monooxygenase subunit A